MSTTAADNMASSSAAPLPAPRRDNAWIWQVTALSVVLGGMLALAVRTTEQARRSTTPGSGRFNLLSALVDRERQESEALQQEIVALRGQKERLLAQVKGGSATARQLNEEFDALRTMAGLRAFEGPGLNIRIQDSPDTPPENIPYEEFLVHDQDLNNIISALKAAGAQHLAISGADSTRLQRVIVSTTARCVGPTAVVNGIYLSAPYHILAIGDPKTLRAALEGPEGYIRQRELDTRKMIEITESEKLSLPEYSGKLQTRYARPLPEEGGPKEDGEPQEKDGGGENG